jgi:hypothetical protein
MGMKLEFVSKKEEAYKTAIHGLVDTIMFRLCRPYLLKNLALHFHSSFLQRTEICQDTTQLH